MSTRHDPDASEPDASARITGSGPLADPGTVTGGPIDDPTLADRNNPRWTEGGESTAPMPDAPPLGGPGTPQDQAADLLEGLLETGTDNIREGRGDVQSNPALAEGGDNG